MQKLIAAVVLALAPFAVWMAGCRQNDQAKSFPKGPEVKSLARAPMAKGGDAGAPAVPAVIDPEVLATPDQPTFARIRAVMDREAQLASRYSQPGLFVLPREDFHDLALAPEEAAPAEPDAMLAAVVPPPLTAREFWSRPPAVSAPSGLDSFPTFAGGDISAMAPPAPAVGQPPLPVEAIPGLFMGVEEPVVVPPANRPLSLNVPPIDETLFPAPSLLEDKWFMAEFDSAAPRFRDPPVSLPPPPTMEKRGRLAELMQKDDIRQALAPLPDISTMKSSVGASFPTPADLAEATASLAWTPSPEAAPPIAARELYLSDFWEKPLAGRSFAESPAAPPETKGASLPSSLETPTGFNAAKTPPPQKITLQPRDRARAEFDRIDSAVDVPPLRF